MRILTYDGLSAAYLRDWKKVGDHEFGWDLHGPVASTINVPKGSSYLHHSNLSPGHQGVYVETDLSDKDLPMWLGQVSGPDLGSEPGDRTVAIDGPQSWLESHRATVAVRGGGNVSAGPLAAELVERLQAVVDLRLIVGEIHTGEAVPYQTDGSSLWSLWGSLQQERGESWYLEPTGDCMLTMHWRAPDHADDISDRVVLREGKDCSWSGAPVLNQTVDQLVLVGQAFDLARGSRVAGLFAPNGRVLGRKAALAAEIAAMGRPDDVEGSAVEIHEGLPHMPAMYLAAEHTLRRGLTPWNTIQVEVTRQSLWKYCRPWKVLGFKLDSDDMGHWTEAKGRITSMSYLGGQQESLKLSVELW